MENKNVNAPLVVRFKEARERAGLSQAEVGTILGRSQRQISDYEQGVTIPSLLQVQKLESLAVPITENLPVTTADLEWLKEISVRTGGSITLGLLNRLIIESQRKLTEEETES